MSDVNFMIDARIKTAGSTNEIQGSRALKRNI